MAGATRLRFSVGGIEEIKAVLAQLADNAAAPLAALKDIGEDFTSIEQGRFASASALWAPLKASSARRKAARGLGTSPLTGGTLEASLAGAGRYRINRINRSGGRVTSITMGTSDPVAHLHQRGTRRMSKRPPVLLTSADAQRWTGIISDHLLGPLRKGHGL